MLFKLVLSKSQKKKKCIFEFYSFLFLGIIPKENKENRLPSGNKGGQKVPRNPKSPKNPKYNNGLAFLFSSDL